VHVAEMTGDLVAGVGAQRRGAERCRACLPVRVSAHHGPMSRGEQLWHEGFLVDLCIGGARLRAGTSFDVGDLIELELVRPNRRNCCVGQRLIAVGRVAWTRRLRRGECTGTPPLHSGWRGPQEIGVEFVTLDPCLVSWFREMTEGDSSSPQSR